MSRPSESVPSQCAAEGGIKREPRSCRSGSYGASTGAKSAQNANTAISASATTFSGLARMGARAASLRPRTGSAIVLAMLRPRVEPEVGDVHNEVGDRVHDRGQQSDTKDRRKIQRDRRRREVAERERRQDQMENAAPQRLEVAGEQAVEDVEAGSRGRRRDKVVDSTAARKPAELVVEEPDHDETEPEHRDGAADEG